MYDVDDKPSVHLPTDAPKKIKFQLETDFVQPNVPFFLFLQQTREYSYII